MNLLIRSPYKTNIISRTFVSAFLAASLFCYCPCAYADIPNAGFNNVACGVTEQTNLTDKKQKQIQIQKQKQGNTADNTKVNFIKQLGNNEDFMQTELLSGDMLNDNDKDSEKPLLSPGSLIVEKMQFPNLDWSVPVLGKDVERIVLSNGAVVFYKRDDNLPIFNLSVGVRGGNLYSTKPGVAKSASIMLKRGGTKKCSWDDLENTLDNNAIRLSTRSTHETSYASITCLEEKVPMALDLLRQVILEPAFDKTQWEILQEQFHEELRRQNDQPGDVAYREFSNLLYGEHPYGHIITWPEIQNITLEDLKNWHNCIWNPKRAYIAISGNLPSKELKKMLEGSFSSWKDNNSKLPSYPKLPESAQPGVYFVNKDVSQSCVYIGHVGVNRFDKDREAIKVLNYILGGGSFSSRLVENIRNRRGLAYTVRSVIQTSSILNGDVAVSLTTKASSTREAIDLVLEEIEGIRTKEVTLKELNQAKDSLTNSVIFEFTSPFGTSSNFSLLEILGHPNDYFSTYQDKVQSVTGKDVLRCAQRVLNPDKLIIVVVGNKDELKGAFDNLGKIHTIELEDTP